MHAPAEGSGFSPVAASLFLKWGQIYYFTFAK
jgi:hypothetical protein